MAGTSGRASRFGCACCGAHKEMVTVHHDGRTDVTIMIVNWNTRSLLERCLSSIKTGVEGLAGQVLVRVPAELRLVG